MLVERPLLFLGFPGVLTILIGIGYLVRFLNLFNETGYFSIPTVLISMGFLLFGMLLLTNSFVLYSIKRTSENSK